MKNDDESMQRINKFDYEFFEMEKEIRSQKKKQTNKQNTNFF